MYIKTVVSDIIIKRKYINREDNVDLKDCIP